MVDNTKAYLSMPHLFILDGLHLLGALDNIQALIAINYRGSTGSYGHANFPLCRSIKEGYPLSPALFMLVSDVFHMTLAGSSLKVPSWCVSYTPTNIFEQ